MDPTTPEHRSPSRILVAALRRHRLATCLPAQAGSRRRLNALLLSGLGEPGSDFPELDVESLGGTAKDIEGFLGRDPESFHQNALCLADDVSRQEASWR